MCHLTLTPGYNSRYFVRQTASGGAAARCNDTGQIRENTRAFRLTKRFSPVLRAQTTGCDPAQSEQVPRYLQVRHLESGRVGLNMVEAGFASVLLAGMIQRGHARRAATGYHAVSSNGFRQPRIAPLAYSA